MKNETHSMYGTLKIETQNTVWYINYNSDLKGFNVQSKRGHDWLANTGSVLQSIDKALKYIRTSESNWQ